MVLFESLAHFLLFNIDTSNIMLKHCYENINNTKQEESRWSVSNTSVKLEKKSKINWN